MKSVGIFFTGFGIAVLIFPEFVVALIGTILILIGLSILLPGLLMSKRSDSSFRFGDYEIIKKKK